VASYEAQLLDGINAERARAGVPAVRLSSCPDALAGSHARRMAERGRHEHQSMEVVLDRCGGRSAGENIGAGSTTPQGLVRAWMDSAGHRDNLLRASWTGIGVGAARTSSGRWYVSTVFHTP
jgi:uncharacterized protein YkwD